MSGIEVERERVPSPRHARGQPRVSGLALAGLIAVVAATVTALPGWALLVSSAHWPWPDWVMNLLRISVPLGVVAAALLLAGDSEIRRSDGRRLEPPLFSLGEILAVLGFVLSFITWLLIIGASTSVMSDL